jgi:sigma54-dependent transcription regulator
MKKYLTVLFVLVSCICVLASNNSFVDSLKNCSSFSDSGQVKTEGMDVQSKKQILGWENNKCVYRETLNFAGINTNVICKFTRSQLDEIFSVMKAYDVVSKYSSENIDTSSSQAVQNNPVVKVWNKYLQDSSVCTFSGLNK